MWTCLNEKPGRKSPGPAARGDSSRTRAMPYTSRKRRFTPSQRRLPAAWLEPLSSRYQKQVRRRDARVVETARTQDTLSLSGHLSPQLQQASLCLGVDDGVLSIDQAGAGRVDGVSGGERRSQPMAAPAAGGRRGLTPGSCTRAHLRQCKKSRGFFLSPV